jgi:hypothetical protein
VLCVWPPAHTGAASCRDKISACNLEKLLRACFPLPHRRSRILDIKTLEEDPGAAQEFARSKASARKEGLTGVEFKDIAGLDPILGEVLEVRGALLASRRGGGVIDQLETAPVCDSLVTATKCTCCSPSSCMLANEYTLCGHA